MIKRMCAMALVLALVCAAALADEVIVKRAVDIIGGEESGHNYACAITDTNGKASLGFMQWNGSRAAALLKAIIALDEKAAEKTLGEELCQTLKAASTCVLTSEQRAPIKALLKSAAGVKAQDAKAADDVGAYVRKAKALGMSDRDAICYYCDIAHQVGSGAVVKYHKQASALAGGYAQITLEHLYRAALKYATYTKARRTRVYNELLKNPVGQATSPEEKPALTIDAQSPLKLPRYQNTALKCTQTGSSETVYWKSSSVKIARVSAKGVVRGIKRGKVKITAYTKSGLSHSITVEVTRPMSAESASREP